MASFVSTAVPAWGVDATVDIAVYNDDYESHEVDVEYSHDGDSGDKWKDLDAGDSKEFSFSTAATLITANDSYYTVYVFDEESDESYCETEISVTVTWWFGADVTACDYTDPQTTACTVDTDTYGSTCKATITINE